MVAQVMRPKRPGTKQLNHDEADTRQVWSKRAHEGAVARRGEIAVRVTSSKGHERIFWGDSHVGKGDKKDGESQRGNSKVRGECREKQRIKVTRKGKGKGKRLMD